MWKYLSFLSPHYNQKKVADSEKDYDEIQKEINELGAKMQDLQPQHAMAKDEMTNIKQNVKKIEVSTTIRFSVNYQDFPW